MNINEYQIKAAKTMLPTAARLDYLVLGLCSEAGEVAGKLKKTIRDDNVGEVFDTAALTAEVADCLWYVAAICSQLGVSLDDVAQQNLEKLADRQKRNAIGGSGDSR